MKKLIYLLIFIQSQNILCQNKKLLQGVWIKEELINNDSKLLENLSTDNLQLKYTFIDDKLYISTNHSKFGNENKIEIINNQILLPYYTLIIEKLDEQNLIVVEPKNGVVNPQLPRTHFIREEDFLKKINLKNCSFYTKNLDTIYKESNLCYATQKELFSGFNNEALMKILNDEGMIYATYVIDERGKIRNIEILHHLNQSSDKLTQKTIEQTNNRWISHKINGIAIKVQKNFSIAKGFSFSGEYKKIFIDAMNYCEQNQIEEAIEKLLQCRYLTNDKSNIDYHLYLCYQKLGKTEESEIYKNNVQNSNLAYLLK